VADRFECLSLLVYSYQMARRGTYFRQTKEHTQRSREQEECAQNVWWGIRELLKKFVMSKDIGVTSCRVCKQSTEDRSNDYSDIETHRE